MVNSAGASRNLKKKIVAATFVMTCMPVASVADGQASAPVQVV